MKKNYVWLFLLTFCMQTAFAATFQRTDFRDETIYFVMTTRFYDGDPTNNTQCWDGQSYNEGDPAWRGDFKGLIEKLDYIKAMGFTAIWITPIVENASGYDYHGYHASNFSKVDHRYLSEDVSLQTLIDAVHAKGMKLIIDIVLNHTGNFGEENLCKLFNRDWTADQSNIEACMIPYTKSEGGKLPDNYNSLAAGSQYSARLSKMKNTADENGQKINLDSCNYWHHYANFNWDDPSRWWAQIAGDCVDLNTENPAVYNYLIKCYTAFIALGVDGFRIDTGGHIPRLTFNKAFIPALQAAAETYKDKRNGFPFYMFAEVCARYTDVTYRGQPNLSCYYYTWKESVERNWDTDASSWNSIVALEGDMCNTHTNHKSVQATASADGSSAGAQPTSDNAFLNGNNYHTTDYTNHSGLNVIDFPMHHNFASIGGAWNVGQKSNDQYYNDATWNVVYVDSHDYAPNGAPEDQRFAKGTTVWAENLDLMYTFRGIPCVYYGSEIEFKKGCTIDKGPNMPLRESGRAYYGGYIKGSVTTSDFATYSNATGNMAATLGHPLAQHIQRLSKIRMAVPALRKGQYSKDNCSGSYAFKRRYTDDKTDSYALVTISGSATFSNILNGTYIDAVTGDTKVVTNNTLTASCTGQGNMRVYVLNTTLTPAPGKIGTDGKFLYTTTAATIADPVWDGTQEELTSSTGTGSSDDQETTVESCLSSENERAVFFTKSSDFGSSIKVYMWIKDTSNPLVGSWPGKAATSLGNGNYKFVVPDDVTSDVSTWMIIWNDGSGNQTQDLTFTMHGLYTGDNKNAISCTGTITKICDETAVEEVESDLLHFYYVGNTLFVDAPQAETLQIFNINGQLIRTMPIAAGKTLLDGLQQGMYIVKSSSKVERILVK